VPQRETFFNPTLAIKLEIMDDEDDLLWSSLSWLI